MPSIGKNKIKIVGLLIVLVIGIFIVASPFSPKAKAYGITFVNSTTGSATLTTGQSDVISVPAGIVPGDLLIAEMTATSLQTFTTPAGWTLEHHNTAFNTMDVFYRVADGTEASSYSFVISGNATSAYGMMAIRGEDTATPFVGVSADSSSTATSTVTVPTVTWGTASDVVSLIAMHASNPTALTITWPSGWDPANGFTSFIAPSNDYMAPNLVTSSGVTSLPTQSVGLGISTNSSSNQFAIKVASQTTFPSNTHVIDNFNRANADPFSNPMSSGDSWALTTLSGGAGGGARLKIVSNTAEPESTSVADADYDTTSTYGPNTEVYATVTATGSATSGVEIGSLYARLTNAGGTSMKAYELQINKGSTSNWLAYRFDSNSTFTELGVLAGSTGSRKSQTISAGDSFGMRVTGTGSMVSIEAWYKAAAGSWTSLGTWTDGSAGRLVAAGKVGLEIQGATTVPQMDDFSGGNSNAVPVAPVQSFPIGGITGVSLSPQFQMRASDFDSDNLQYKVNICSTSNCSSIVTTADQTSSQTGWYSQDKSVGTAYTGGASTALSTIANYHYQSTLSPLTQYWWRAYAIDPGGTNTFSNVSGIGTFTTGVGGPSVVAVTHTNGSGSTAVMTKPAGVQVGDVMIATAGVNSSATSWTPPAGWTLFHQNNTAGELLDVWYRVVDGSEGSSFTFTPVGFTIDGGWGIIDYRGIDNTTPILGVSSDYGSTGPTSSFPVNSVSWAGAANAISLITFTYQSTVSAATWPAGWDEAPEGFNDNDTFEWDLNATNMTTNSAVTSLPAQVITPAATPFGETNQYALKVAALNTTPATPTLVYPAASATNISTTPIFNLRTTDAENNYTQYYLQLYDATACGGSLVGTFDQTSSQTHWQGQDANSTTAYSTSSSIGGSTIARYQYSGTSLIPNHLYSWRAKAIDPGGSNTFSSLTSCQDFTTNTSEADINGGVNINGGTTIQ